MRRSAHRSVFQAAGLALAVLQTHRSRAADARWLDLKWRAPPECPTGAEMEQQIAHLVGIGPRDRRILHAGVDISADERGWHAHVTTDYGGEPGNRAVEGASCHAVARAVALVIALDVDSGLGHLDEQRLPQTPREVDSSSRTPRFVETPHPPTLDGYLTVGVRSQIGLLPNLALGVGIAVGARAAGASVEVAGAGYLPETTTVPDTNVGGHFKLFTVELRVCPNLLRGSIELFGCVSAGLARLSADGFGVNSPGSAATTLGIFALGPGVGFLLSPAYRLGIGGDVSYVPGDARFVLSNIGLVHQAAKVGGSARIEGTWYW